MALSEDDAFQAAMQPVGNATVHPEDAAYEAAMKPVTASTMKKQKEEGYLSKWFSGIGKSAVKFGTDAYNHPVDSLLGLPRGIVETVASPIAHTVSNAAAAATNAVSKIPGVGSALNRVDSALGASPEAATPVDSTYEKQKALYDKEFGNRADPHTEIGQDISDVAGAIFKPAGDLMSLPGKGVSFVARKLGYDEETQKSAEEQTNALTNATALGMGIRKTNPKQTESSSSLLDQKQKTLKDAQELGYVVPPSTSNPTALNNLAEGFAGKLSTAQGASIKNQPVTNALARQELGLPEDVPLTHETMSLVRRSADPAYEAVKQEPQIIFGPKYEKELSGLTKSADKINSALPNYKSTGSVEVKNLIDSIKPEGGVMDGETAVELSKSLRSEAKAYDLTASRTGDPHARSLSRAYRGAAEAVENAIEDHFNDMGKPEIAANWDAARRLIAKSYSIENALDGAGNVDAGKLGKQLLKGKPLSPKLEAAANFALHFPKAAKVVNESMPGMSPLDIYGSVGAAVISNNPAPLLLGPGRMAARSLLLGPAGQHLASPGNAISSSLIMKAAQPATLAGLLGQKQQND